MSNSTQLGPFRLGQQIGAGGAGAVYRGTCWLLETAGEYANEAGWKEAAREIWQLALTLWRRLGDTEAADSLEQRITAL